MLTRTTRFYCLLLLTMNFLLSATVSANTYTSKPRQQVLADLPTVDPNYVYDQLFFMATHFQRREAGYDNKLAVTLNGHDEFANYWAKELTRNLQGFGIQIRRDAFSIKGWTGRASTTQAFNVEGSVP